MVVTGSLTEICSVDWWGVTEQGMRAGRKGRQGLLGKTSERVSELLGNGGGWEEECLWAAAAESGQTGTEEDREED